MIVKQTWLISMMATALMCVATPGFAQTDLRLVEAVKSRDHANLEILLRDKVDVNATEPDGASALAWAVYWDDIDTAGLLLRAGADTNIANDYGVTPLMLACTNGNAAMVQRLLESRANPNAAQWMGVTPLMVCTRSGNVDAVKSLLLQGADVNAKDTRRGQTALMWAASREHLEVARILTEYGADTNAKTHLPDDFTKMQFITYGIEKRDPSRPDIIRDEDVHPDPLSSRGGFTPLMFAARQGDMDMARVLIAAGADVNATSPEYGSALVVAAANGHEDLALYLLEQKADPNVSDAWSYTPLHYSLQGGLSPISMSRPSIPTDRDWLLGNYPNLVESLLTHGADPNARVDRGFPPFNHPKFARTTGNSMPEIRQPGATPFFLAAASLDADLMRLLLSHGADPLLTTDEGTTPLMVAAGMGRQNDITAEQEANALEATRLAWELGNDVNASNQDGRTALAAAAYHGANSLIEFLVDKGADLKVKDRYGQTALSIAQGTPYKVNGQDKRFRRASEHKSAAELLLSLGAQ